MEILEIYADAAGETHFRIAAVTFEPRSFAPPSPPIGVAADVQPKAAFFLELPPGWDKAFHPTPRKQYSFIVSGELTVETSDGTVKRLGPGGCVLFNDVGSKGHLTQVQGNVSAYAWMVTLE